MRFKIVRRAILAAVLVGAAATTALSQIPVPPPPPLPGLDVRIATGRPPRPRYERRYPRPGPGYAWVRGFWNWDGGRWGWVSGRWERPAIRDAYWIAPRYVRSDRGYIYEPGHWSGQRLVVSEEVRGRREWRRHEREHDRELERERDRNRYRDRGRDR
jgi:hypothetical protein